MRWLVPLFLLAPVSAGAQVPAMPGPFPPLPGGYSAARLELTPARRFTLDERGWTPALHADVAIDNSKTRIAGSVARSPGEGSADAGLGFGLMLTRVVRDTESPAWLTWLSLGGGTVSLAPEGVPGGRAWEVIVSGGRAKRFTPPAIGELLVGVVPRMAFIRLGDPPAGVDRSGTRFGGTLVIDWGSQANLGAMIALDVDHSAFPAGATNQLQAAFRFGASYRFLLFPRKHPMPPPED